MDPQPKRFWSRNRWAGDFAILVYLAGAMLIVHLLTGNRYGFHRDELATLDDARHLAWGYVAYPPLTPFFARLSLALFGTSLAGFRFFAALADSVAIVITGLIARELGGGRGAQVLAVCASVPFAMVAGTLMQYVSFDYLFWILTAYFIVCLAKSEDPRWWLAIGSAIGLGMLTKYSMLFLVVGLVTGVVFTDFRRYLKSKWLWLGAACSIIIFFPNLLWQTQHHFISIDFLRHIHERDVRIGRTKDFLPDQLLLMLFACPLAVIGLCFYLFAREGRRFRVIGWMYVIPFVLFIVAKGRGYYLAPAYPMLYAAGATQIEKWLGKLRGRWSRPIWVMAGIALFANILIAAAVAVPIAPIHSAWWRTASRINGDLVEEVGWPELVETIARVRDSLPESDRAHLAILAGNYGEAGAINLYGPRYGLPTAISGTNSYWQRGYGNPPPETVIVVGFSREFVERCFETWTVAAHSWNRYGVANEETKDHPDIFVCRGLRQRWPDFWKGFQRYGRVDRVNRFLTG
jgi:Dolichyl-phosphate-mannose-protein mannosyltransferase